MRKKITKAFISVVISIIILCIVGFQNNGIPIQRTINESLLEDNLIVSFLDVGQADCIIIQEKDKTLMIDAGNNNDEAIITNFLDKNNIQFLDYLILTHGHEDHIGSADMVIKKYHPKTVIMPEQNPTPTTKAYKNVLHALLDTQTKITLPVVGKTYQLENTSFKILGPNSRLYEDSNNYSVIVKLKCDEVSFLFMGDAEKESENEILEQNFDLESDILKIGHHGSSSSSSSRFIKTVNPKYAVISAAKDNDYGHPHKETISVLKNNDTEVLYTKNGTIKIETDGINIWVK